MSESDNTELEESGAPLKDYCEHYFLRGRCDDCGISKTDITKVPSKRECVTMTNLTQTIADAAKMAADKAKSWDYVTDYTSGFTAGANLILPMLEAERAKSLHLFDAGAVQAKKLKIATEALEKIASEGIDTSTDGGIEFVREALK